VSHLEDLEAASRRRLASLSSRLAALEGASGSLVADTQAAGGRGAAELSACLTAAAGLEAKIGGLERRLAAVSQVGLGRRATGWNVACWQPHILFVQMMLRTAEQVAMLSSCITNLQCHLSQGGSIRH
jgi:hypothetical protein